MTCHLFMHLIDNGDTNNARHLWKRAPDNFQKGSKALQNAWSVAKAIKAGQYGQAINLLEAPVRDEDKSNFITSCEQLRQTLAWMLRYRTVPQVMKSCYSTIELQKLKEMLGLSKEATPKFMTLLRGEHMGR